MYQPFSPAEWSGRVDAQDGNSGLRWHQVIESAPEGGGNVCTPAAPRIALLGFACDAGVARNSGRIGAAEGPRALRGQLGNLPASLPVPLYDAGTVAVDPKAGEALEDAQTQFGARLASLLDAGHFVIGLGGGHEISWATYLGIRGHLQHRDRPVRLGVLNFDAHLDLRTPAPEASSGTGFKQIADDCARTFGTLELSYACVGISPASNTAALYGSAESLGAAVLEDTECTAGAVRVFVDSFVSRVEMLYVSIDLDVLSAAVAPGVSAPAALGIDPSAVVCGLRAVGRSCREHRRRLLAADVAELNPVFDADHRTARTAARLVFEIARLRDVSGEDPGFQVG